MSFNVILDRCLGGGGCFAPSIVDRRGTCETEHKEAFGGCGCFLGAEGL